MVSLDYPQVCFVNRRKLGKGGRLITDDEIDLGQVFGFIGGTIQRLLFMNMGQKQFLCEG